MNEEHFCGKVSQKAIIVKDGKVLITRDSRDETTWELPGGRLNAQEDPRVGLTRELREELGVVVIVEQPVFIGKFHHTRDKSDALAVFYKATLEDEAVQFTVDPIEISEMQWVDQETWQNYTYYDEVKNALESYFSTI
jgi:8-oxo-dGTP diphosphatase